MFSICALLTFGFVSGHASMSPPVSPAGFSQSNVRVPHGCNGTDTTSVQVTIPAGLSSVKPTKVAGWTLTMTTRPLAVPIKSESGADITTEVDKITWSGGSLPDNQYQDFGITFRVPPSQDGTKFYFPVLQTCITGFNNWSMIPTGDGAKLSYPAPAFTVMANNTMLKADSMGTGSALRSTGSSTNGAAQMIPGLLSVACLALVL